MVLKSSLRERGGFYKTGKQFNHNDGIGVRPEVTRGQSHRHTNYKVQRV
jgi:hypothetical protein